MINWVYNQDMARPSNRTARRAQIVAAFARVLADHGFAGATMVAVAEEAGCAPGLLHYHFRDKQEMLEALLADLMGRFRARLRVADDAGDPLASYVDAALKLDEGADVVAARCWVSLLAEALRDPGLFGRVKRLIDAEVSEIGRRGGGRLSSQRSGAVLAFVVGSLVVGAFAPRKTAGFAAPSLHAMLRAFV